MVVDDWSYCPHCEFPAIYSQFDSLLRKIGQCPMCNKDVAPESLVHVKDPSEFLKSRDSVEEGALLRVVAEINPVPGFSHPVISAPKAIFT